MLFDWQLVEHEDGVQLVSSRNTCPDCVEIQPDKFGRPHGTVSHQYYLLRSDEYSKDFPSPTRSIKQRITWLSSTFPLTRQARSSWTFPQTNNSVSAELNLTASAILHRPSPLILFERISKLERMNTSRLQTNKDTRVSYLRSRVLDWSNAVARWPAPSSSNRFSARLSRRRPHLSSIGAR